MELFLNLCWLTLLLPAYLLWRESAASQPRSRASFVIVCTLGCALLILFPVISASDDLHAVGQAMEESKRDLLKVGLDTGAVHSFGSCFALPVSAGLTVAFDRVGTVLVFSPGSPVSMLANTFAGRSPPFPPVSL